MSNCTIEGCEGKVFARAMCQKHYRRESRKSVQKPVVQAVQAVQDTDDDTFKEEVYTKTEVNEMIDATIKAIAKEYKRHDEDLKTAFRRISELEHKNTVRESINC